MIRIRGDEENGYLAMVNCDECDTCVVFQHADHGLWVGSPRQVRIYLTDHAGWVWDNTSDAVYCPDHFR
ncbi:MAG TPA: hypothetical protein VE287_04350 [Actinopolymorphaceae bacterium]|nr:hypothetical protein [Actinopolymorphaceae bacterium]